MIMKQTYKTVDGFDSYEYVTQDKTSALTTW